MTKQRKFGLEEKTKNEGRFTELLGEYVRVFTKNSTIWGVLHRTDYETTVINPFLNIVSHPNEPNKIIYAKEEDKPAILDTKEISVSYLGKEAFGKYLEKIVIEPLLK